MMTLRFAYAIFSLPVDSWARAKEIEQKLAEEGAD